MERKGNIIKKAFLIISFCAFLYIALGFSLQQIGQGKTHLCPYSSDTASTCVTNNLTHLQHWLSFLSFNLPDVFDIVLTIVLAFLFIGFKKYLFNFFNTVKVSFKRNNFS